MKTWIKTTLAASLIALAGAGTALARGGECDGFRPLGKAGWQQMSPEALQSRMTQRMDLQLARLELALALKPAQQPAWESFKSAMHERAGKMAERLQQRFKDDRPQTAVERLERMEEMSKLHLAEVSETRKAVEKFYATLTDAQKKVFDADFKLMGSMRPEGRHGGMGPKGEPGPRGDSGRG